jgi:hypothetical protein
MLAGSPRYRFTGTPLVVTILGIVTGACGTVHSPLANGPELHRGEIACHGVLAPVRNGGHKAIFFCAGGLAQCESSRTEQLDKGLTVSDCAAHPTAACMPSNGDDGGQICLASMRECEELAEVAGREASTCSRYESDASEARYRGVFAGTYDTNRGWAVVLMKGKHAELRSAAGVMTCSVAGEALDCRTGDATKTARAQLAQQADGSLDGTFVSANGAAEKWTMRRAR